VPDLSIAATDHPLRPGQYVYVETHAWWLTTHGPHQLLAEHRLRQWVPADPERCAVRDDDAHAGIERTTEQQRIAESLGVPMHGSLVAGLLGIMFAAFLIQIVFRYFFNFPIGWSSELSVVTWLYMVLIGSAFWLKETEEVRFDLISGSLGPKGRRAIGLIVLLTRKPITDTSRFETLLRVAASRTSSEMERSQVETRLRHVFDSNMVGIVFWNSAGGISDANDAFLQIVHCDCCLQETLNQLSKTLFESEELWG
jgi:PAS domain-containing protein